jgi:hypothetical protein
MVYHTHNGEGVKKDNKNWPLFVRCSAMKKELRSFQNLAALINFN